MTRPAHAQTSPLRIRAGAGTWARIGAWALGGALLALPASAHATDPLALVPESGKRADAALGLRLEVWHQHTLQGGNAGLLPARRQRAVVELRREWALGERTRLGLSNRSERHWSPHQVQTRNALRELYLSHQLRAGWFVDLGRIHWRHGVAHGYNPTDFLRAGAAIEQATQDPRALRENRLGSVMLRQQWLGQAGSVQLALLPSLRNHSNASPRAFAWSRTNPANAALLKLAPTLNERTTFDAVLYWQSGDAPRYGGNLTHLLGDAWVLYAEAAHGRKRQLNAPVPATSSATDTGTDWAVGASWTTPPGPVLTLELQRDARDATRAAFVRIAWDRPFALPHASVNAFVRRELQQPHRSWQVEWAWELQQAHTLLLMLSNQRQRATGPHSGTTVTLGWRSDF